MDPTKFDPANPEHLRVDSIERDKQEEDAKSREAELNTTLLFLYTGLELLKSAFQAHSEAEQPSVQDLQEDTLLIERLQLLFEQLIESDCSHDPEFIASLALAYQHVNALISDTPQTEAEYLLSVFIKTLSQYPKDGSTSLHEYLIRTTTLEWLPFPFMEMLQALHLEATEEPKKSHLFLWVHQLSYVLTQ